MEPGAIEKIPSDISAVVRGSKIVLVGSMVTYREIDMSSPGADIWIDDLNIGNALYYLHIGFDPAGETTGAANKNKGEVVAKIHEMVIQDDGVKYLSTKPALKIKLQEAEAYDKQQVQKMSPGPAVTETPKEAPVILGPLSNKTTDDPKMYDVPEAEGEALENIIALAKNSNLSLAKALVASTEIGDKDLLTWKQVCNYLAKGEIDNKFYIAIKNSKFRGKVIEGSTLVELANFLDTL